MAQLKDMKFTMMAVAAAIVLLAVYMVTNVSDEPVPAECEDPDYASDNPEECNPPPEPEPEPGDRKDDGNIRQSPTNTTHLVSG